MAIKYGSKEYADAMKKLANSGGLSGTQFGNKKPSTPAATKPSSGGDYTQNSSTSSSYTGSSGGSSSADSYKSLLAKYEREQQRAAEQAREAQELARKAAYDTGVGALGQASDSALRQAYISKMQAENKLPQQNALMGNGGMSESSLIGLNASYGNNRADIESTRLAGIAELQGQLQQGRAIDESNYQNRIADISANNMNAQLAYQQRLEDAMNQRMLAETKAQATAKPRLSFSQAKSILDSGVDSPDAMEAYSYYAGAGYQPDTAKLDKQVLGTSKVKNWMSALERNLEANAGTGWSDRDKIANVISQQYNSGMFTKAEAEAMARYYGI